MCGIIGIQNNPESAMLAYMGLYAQQHRGQEGAGIVSSNGSVLHRYMGQGLVSDVFSDVFNIFAEQIFSLDNFLNYRNVHNSLKMDF